MATGYNSPKSNDDQTRIICMASSIACQNIAFVMCRSLQKKDILVEPNFSFVSRWIHIYVYIYLLFLLFSDNNNNNNNHKKKKKSICFLGVLSIVSIEIDRELSGGTGSLRWTTRHEHCSTSTLGWIDDTECCRFGKTATRDVSFRRELRWPFDTRTKPKCTTETITKSKWTTIRREDAKATDRPVVHATIEKRIVHGIAHGEEVRDQIDVRRAWPFRNGFVDRGHNEIELLRKPSKRGGMTSSRENALWPANAKDQDHGDEHFHHLSFGLNRITLAFRHFTNRWNETLLSPENTSLSSSNRSVPKDQGQCEYRLWLE